RPEFAGPAGRPFAGFPYPPPSAMPPPAPATLGDAPSIDPDSWVPLRRELFARLPSIPSPLSTIAPHRPGLRDPHPSLRSAPALPFPPGIPCWSPPRLRDLRTVRGPRPRFLGLHRAAWAAWLEWASPRSRTR